MATLSDTPTPLSLAGYRGNDLLLELTLLGDSAMPVVSSTTRYAVDGRLLPDRCQASVTMTGRIVRLLWSNTDQMPDKAYHEIRFGSRTELAGGLLFSQTTTSLGTTVRQVEVRSVSGISVQVTVLGGSGGGGTSDRLHRLAGETIVVGTPVSLSANNLAYGYSSNQKTHAYTLAGIAVTSAPAGSVVEISQAASIRIPGWGLTPGAVYRAGPSGLITGAAPPGAQFSQIIGRALSADELAYNPQSIILNFQ